MYEFLNLKSLSLNVNAVLPVFVQKTANEILNYLKNLFIKISLPNLEEEEKRY